MCCNDGDNDGHGLRVAGCCLGTNGSFYYLQMR
jgi:hypothetical protein